jgi:signal transduction histidine kinase
MEFTEDKSKNDKLDALSQYISLLNKSMVRMDGFIGDILDYSRNARLTIKKEEIPLFELVNEILNQHRYMNGKKHNLKVENKIMPSTIIQSDRLRLTIILSNLISNSFKFYDANKKNPYINILAKKNGSKILLYVKDNGIGIPVKHQNKVFDMFYRASNQDVGSGLGLYIAQESVQRINGTIECESVEKKGTTFTLQIPI